MFAKPKYIADETVQSRYEAQQEKLPGQAQAWLKHRRDGAVEAFGQTGYPAGTVEQWKFTSAKTFLTLPDAAQARPHQGDIKTAADKLDALPAGPRIVFVNGVFNTSLSQLPEAAGVNVEPLSKLLKEQPGLAEAYLGHLSGKEAHGFALANLALAEDGLAIRLEEGVNLELPLVWVNIFTGGAQALQVFTRNLIVLNEGAALEMIEYTIGVPDAVYAANQVTEVYLDGAAKLNHTLIQEQSAQGAEINSRYVQAEQDSLYHSTVFTTGARVNRVETVAELLGEKAHVDVQTVQLVRDHLHSDSTTVVTHDTENATSNQHCRIVLDDAAKGAFQGKTIVARDAQKTDAHQLNKNLLLSRTATVNTKPELEIYADDVACSHGATTGELDAMALFYLQSRGVDEATARRLLVEAFADEVIETAPLAGEVRDVLRDKIARWMEQRA